MPFQPGIFAVEHVPLEVPVATGKGWVFLQEFRPHLHQPIVLDRTDVDLLAHLGVPAFAVLSGNPDVFVAAGVPAAFGVGYAQHVELVQILMGGHFRLS